MAEAEAEAEVPPPKKSRKGLLIGLLGALALGSGAGYVVYAGLVPLPFAVEAPKKSPAHDQTKISAAFVPLPTIIVALSGSAPVRHLQLTAYVETSPDQAAQIKMVQPRILDVLNTFLRAVREEDVIEPASLARLRAQMLRRVRLVAGPNRVTDLLIGEFILN